MDIEEALAMLDANGGRIDMDALRDDLDALTVSRRVVDLLAVVPDPTAALGLVRWAKLMALVRGSGTVETADAAIARNIINNMCDEGRDAYAAVGVP